MSLRQLAGPFNLVDDNGDAVSPVIFNPGGMYPGFGLLMQFTVFGQYFLCRVALDGVVEAIGPWTHTAPWVWDDVNNWLIIGGSVIEPIILCPSPYTSYPGYLPWQLSWGSFVDYINAVFESNRALALAGGYLGQPSGGGIFSGFTNEYTLPTSFDGADGNVGPGRHPGEVFFAQLYTGSVGSDLQCGFYDTVNRVLSSQIYHLGVGQRAAYYDQDNGIIVSIVDTPQWCISIWSLEVIPDHLSAVTVVGGVASNGITTYQVQVLGVSGDWCVGVLVDWTLVSGPGELIDTQTTTDANGYATCRVLYAAAGGTSVVEASVIC